MKQVMKRVSSLLFLITPLFLLAGDGDEDDHVPVGTRPPHATEEESHTEVRCGYIFDRYPPVYIPAHNHYFIPATREYTGTAGVTEDSAVWALSQYDGYKALEWISYPDPHDPNRFEREIPLVITQNFSWFSNYKYRILNKITGESVEANLRLGPRRSNHRSRFIAAWDLVTKEVVLNDNSRFLISPSDTKKFNQWALGNYVIKGINGGWSTTYESILINVNVDNFVHAREIQPDSTIEGRP